MAKQFSAVSATGIDGAYQTAGSHAVSRRRQPVIETATEIARPVAGSSVSAPSAAVNR